VDVEFGISRSFTQGSDGWVVKGIFGYAFPVEVKTEQSGETPAPFSIGTPSRSAQYNH